MLWLRLLVNEIVAHAVIRINPWFITINDTNYTLYIFWVAVVEAIQFFGTN